MTVLRNLPSQLILAHAPWFLGGGLIVCIIACAAAGLTLIAQGEWIGVITVALGAAVPLGIFALAIKRDQVIFDAHAGICSRQLETINDGGGGIGGGKHAAIGFGFEGHAAIVIPGDGIAGLEAGEGSA